MIDDAIRKCFKVSSLKERDSATTIVGDVVYVRSHPFVYVNTGYDGWQQFTKIYTAKSHPKYNLDKKETLEGPYMFKIENRDSLVMTPAKPGDLIYKNGDPFMYMKTDEEWYVKIRKE